MIAIDAGHGLKTAGKRIPKSLDADNTREWTLNSRIAEYVIDLLDKYGFDTLRVDDSTGETDVKLYKRVEQANVRTCELYISIHHNAGVKCEPKCINCNHGGIVVYYYPSTKKGSKNEEMADRLATLAIAETGLDGNRYDHTIATRGLYVVRKTKMPALLIECGFMDSAHDVPIIKTDEHARACARAIAQLCIEYCKPDKEVKEKCKCECGCEACIGCVEG